MDPESHGNQQDLPERQREQIAPVNSMLFSTPNIFLNKAGSMISPSSPSRLSLQHWEAKDSTADKIDQPRWQPSLLFWGHAWRYIIHFNLWKWYHYALRWALLSTWVCEHCQVNKTKWTSDMKEKETLTHTMVIGRCAIKHQEMGGMETSATVFLPCANKSTR